MKYDYKLLYWLMGVSAILITIFAIRSYETDSSLLLIMISALITWACSSVCWIAISTHLNLVMLLEKKEHKKPKSKRFLRSWR